MEDLAPQEPPGGGGSPPGSSDECEVFVPYRIPDRVTRWRNKVGFWTLGLCNNMAYVVMLSAARDILAQQENGTVPITGWNDTEVSDPHTVLPPAGDEWNSTGQYDCNSVSTAAILLADILPTLVIKVTAPFFVQHVPYGYRVVLCTLSALASFLIVSFSVTAWMSILGVVFASLSSGLGEYTFLALTSYFHVDVVSCWSSGTGAAGLLGAVSYSGLTQTGLSPRNSLLLMVIVPAALCSSFLFLLVKPAALGIWSRHPVSGGQEYQPILDQPRGCGTSSLTFRTKLAVIKSLTRYMLPLGVVYFAEYFINQGLLELLYFRNIFLDHNAQYRWYQTLYQLGVFASRSSAPCVRLHRIWVLALLQVLNVLVLGADVWSAFIPSIWIIFLLVLYEGLLGGAAYVNTFRNIRIEVEEDHREFAMGAASIADTLGIALCGAVAVPLHNYLCRQA